MGVSCDQHLGMFCRPRRKALFDGAFFRTVFCGAGRVIEGKKLQRAPDIPDEETAELPKGIIKQVALVPMHEKYTLPADPVF